MSRLCFAVDYGPVRRLASLAVLLIFLILNFYPQPDAVLAGEARSSSQVDSSLYLPMVIHDVVEVIPDLVVTLNAVAGRNLITLTWVSRYDTGYQGYNVYRAARSDGNLRIINSNLIPVQPGDPAAGITYSIVDRSCFSGVIYDYFVEAIDANGIAKIVATDWAAIPPT